MDARRWIGTILLVLTSTTSLQAANEISHRTSNFVVQAPTQEIAKQVGEVAEYWRDELAVQWLGEKLPRWYEPCKVTVKVGQIGAGGATTFSFEGGEVFGWNMRVQGTLERILDSVIPHEVSHTIFACHFRRPLPRWADEGAATLTEHISERTRQLEILEQVSRNKQRIPLSQLLEIDEYPKDMQQVLALYAEGYSLADFLVQQHGDKGRQVYLAFLKDALAGNWEAAFRKHYGFANLKELDQTWDKWVIAGSPKLHAPEGSLLAQASGTKPVTTRLPVVKVTPRPQQPQTETKVAIRGQSEASGLIPLPRVNRPLRTAAVTNASASRTNGPSPELGESIAAPPPAALPKIRRMSQSKSTGHTAGTAAGRIPLQLTQPRSQDE
jgi:hypothetical protein